MTTFGYGRQVQPAILLLVVAAVISPAGANDSSRTAKSYTVLIKGFQYQPDNLSVHVGDTVEWNNGDLVAHTATANDKSFDSGKIKPGSSWKMVANTAGTHDYICTLHPNMKAKLIVQ